MLSDHSEAVGPCVAIQPSEASVSPMHSSRDVEDFLPLQYTRNDDAITPGIGTDGGPASFEEMIEGQVSESEIAQASPAAKPKRPFLKRGEGCRVTAKSPANLQKAKQQQLQQQRETKPRPAQVLEERSANLDCGSSAPVKHSMSQPDQSERALNGHSYDVSAAGQFPAVEEEDVELLEFEEFERSIEQNSAAVKPPVVSPKPVSPAAPVKLSNEAEGVPAKAKEVGMFFDDSTPWPSASSQTLVSAAVAVSSFCGGESVRTPIKHKPQTTRSPASGRACITAKCKTQRESDAARIEQLVQQLAKVQAENGNMKLLKTRHERELRAARKEVEKFDLHKQQEIESLKSMQADEQTKFNKAKKQLYKQLRTSSNKDQQNQLQGQVDEARAELEELKESSSASEAKLAMTVDRLKKRLTIQSNRIGELEEELTLSESMRSNDGQNQAVQIDKLRQRMLSAETSAQELEKSAQEADGKLQAAERLVQELESRNKVQLAEIGRVIDHALWLQLLQDSLLTAEPRVKEDILSQHFEGDEDFYEDDDSSDNDDDGVEMERSPSPIEASVVNLALIDHSPNRVMVSQPADCPYSPRTCSGEPASPSVTSYGKDVVKTQEYTTQDGTKVALYSNGTRKESFCDGDSIIHFINGDHKQMLSNGQVVYFYAETQTTHTTRQDGMQIFQFPDGQVETQFPDGTQEIVFSDGTEKIDFSDGTVQLKDAFGNERGLGSIT